MGPPVTHTKDGRGIFSRSLNGNPMRYSQILVYPPFNLVFTDFLFNFRNVSTSTYDTRSRYSTFRLATSTTASSSTSSSEVIESEWPQERGCLGGREQPGER